MKIPTILVSAALTSSMPCFAGPESFFGDPPDATHPWAKHDQNRPQPPRVEPAAKPGDPPSDAVVLFDGTEASMKQNWLHVRDNRKADWEFKDGAMQSTQGAGYIQSKAEFGDCQLHVEWAAPSKVQGNGQGRGNSGVFLMGIAEVQVLDNFNNPSYPDGSAGAVYGIMPPMANVLRPPSEWQSYDIIFRRPITKDGKVVDEGSMTVFVNGVLVQDHTPLEGGGGYRKRTQPIPFPEKGSFPEKGALHLQDHGNPVRFRNIWYREIRKRPSDGGTDGQLSPEATQAKRAEIAAGVLKDAESLTGNAKMLRLLESLMYQPNESVLKQVNQMGEAYVKELNSIAKDALPNRKGEVVEAYRAFRYMNEHKLIPAANPTFSGLDEIMIANQWKK